MKKHLADSSVLKNTFSRSEWTLVFSLLLIMASLVVIARVNVARTQTVIAAESLHQEPISVSIEGMVSKPGIYSVLAGTPLREVLRKARPKPLANLQILPLDSLIEEEMSIKVEALKEVVVRVEGAVLEPKEIIMAAGSRICDLKTKVILTHEANKAFFRRKRVLKNGEKIDVPKKVVE